MNSNIDTRHRQKVQDQCTPQDLLTGMRIVVLEQAAELVF